MFRTLPKARRTQAVASWNSINPSNEKRVFQWQTRQGNDQTWARKKMWIRVLKGSYKTWQMCQMFPSFLPQKKSDLLNGFCKLCVKIIWSILDCMNGVLPGVWAANSHFIMSGSHFPWTVNKIRPTDCQSKNQQFSLYESTDAVPRRPNLGSAVPSRCWRTFGQVYEAFDVHS